MSNITCLPLERYRVQSEQLENLSRMSISALEGFSTLGYKTNRLNNLITNVPTLGLETIDLRFVDILRTAISTEDSKTIRDALVKVGIGAKAQQMLEMIVQFILRLLGSRGQRPADMDIVIAKEIQYIKDMSEERITHTRLPEFTHPQFKQNWDTQWSSYRDTMAEVDGQYSKMTPEEFYLNFKVPRGRDLYVKLGSMLMKGGLPICYLKDNREYALRRFMELIVDTKNAISKLSRVSIGPDGSVIYDQSNIDDLITELEATLAKDWDYAESGDIDWLTGLRGSAVPILRKIDGNMEGLENITRLLSRSIRLDDRIRDVVSSVPEDEMHVMVKTVNINIRQWTNHFNTLVRLIGLIYSRITNAELTIMRTIKQYRRTLDIIVKN